MVHFIGAGPGDPELLTIKGKKLIDQADVIIYAGSLVNKEVLAGAKEGAEIYNSATMTLEEVIEVMKKAEAEGKMTARVHTGDPAVFGAHREQMDELSRLGIDYDVIPGVSSFLATAAALKKEYTLPGVSQTVILTRMEGRTPMPPKEKLRDLAKHNSTMIIFLSVGMIEQLADTLKAHVLHADGNYEKVDRRGKAALSSQDVFCKEAMEAVPKPSHEYQGRVFIPAEPVE